MRERLFLLVCAAMLASCASHKPVAIPYPVSAPENCFSPSVLIIMVDAETGKGPLKEAIKAYKAELIYDYQNINGVAIRIPNNRTMDEAIKYFENVKGVISVQRDEIMQLQ